MTGTVSVALCTRNGADFVVPQVESILRQSSLPIEVIVSDDASTDDTVHRIRAVFAGLPEGSREARVRLVVIENPKPLGVTKNFEQALLACSGDLIALCDQDDLWDEGRLEKQAAEMWSHPHLTALFGDARLVDASGTSLGLGLFDALEIDADVIRQVRSGAAFDVLLRRNVATGATMMVRRELLDSAAPFPLPWVHDEWLAIIAAATASVDLMTERLVDYRQHGANQIGVRRATLRVKIRRVLEPRGDRNAGLAVRSGLLVERLTSLGSRVPAPYLERARAKERVEEWRTRLPDARLLRLGPILQANARHWYSDFTSQGRLDMVRDLLQPHR
ncbi:glycosyltransferase family 2 protein [Glaciihabitans sp. INWT7]|uniref:glycosyltransferase family 2 protein n=1 Tax=Glaciihabitans sp. INWT7 TaxID=2596912 RepID=UPI001627F14B|nr:glycosyltransferase family 2 protein [Glaciihabitans sp. INWT7]QNE45984.1 glycosyltransferase family 2 protein [Glaciihabitans sp. INWT7]